MIKIDSVTKNQLKEVYKTKNVGIEGNILKLIDTEDDIEFKKYIKDCSEKDKDNRRKRLEVTKQVQNQNNELVKLNSENKNILLELQTTLTNVELSKQQIEIQNQELIDWKEDNQRLTTQLQEEMVKSEVARVEAEKSKESALNDLDILQKKTQTELIGTVVKVALIVILSVGIITTGMYCVALYNGKDTQIIGSTWSNMFGILLTNAFSIIGTIMGVKYASEKK
jgi:hypothetical protein